MYGPLLQALERGHTVVTGNNRLARSLARAYGRRQQAAGRLAWDTPAVLSWQAWLAQLWSDSEMAGGRAAELALLSDTEATVLWEEIARGARLDDRFDKDQADTGQWDKKQLEKDHAGGGNLAMQAWQQLCEWDAVAADEWVTAGLSPDQQLFLRWTGAYRGRLSDGGWIDRALLARELIHDVRAGLFDNSPPLTFTGFDTWTPTRVGLRQALADRGVKITSNDETAAHNQHCQRVQCLDDRDELETAARWARARVEANPDENVCVVVRNFEVRAEEARRIFMDVFCPDWRTRAAHHLPVNFSYGRPLGQQPRVAAAINLLWLAQGDTEYQRFSLALRTPFLQGGREEANERAQLDLRLRDRLGSSFRLRDAAAFAGRYAPGFAAVVEKLVAAAPAGQGTLAEWADWMGDVLKSVAWPGDESLDSTAYQEIEAWQQLLRELAASSRVRAPGTLGSALRLLERLAAGRLHQPEGGAGVVQVMGLLEAAGHEFDALWVAGLAAEDWPAAAAPNPLLPFDLQRRCDMPGSSPARELRYAENLTRRLLGSSAHVTLSWPGERDGEALHASGLMAAVEPADKPACWPESDWISGMLGAAPLELLDDDPPLPWTPEAKARGGAYLFRLQASCPLRAYLELRLGATDIEPPVSGISYKERGSLAHNVLEKFYTRHADSAALQRLDDDSLQTELGALVDAELANLPGAGRPFIRAAAALERLRLMPLLIEFVRLDQARDSFKVLRVEDENRQVSVGPLTLALKLDRLDQLATGELLVIDYKTGQVRKNAWNPARPSDMQLPLYATFTEAHAEGVAFAQLSAHGVKYDGIAVAGIVIDGIETPEQTRTRLCDAEGEKLTDWAALTAAWQSVLVDLATRFAAGDCSVNPQRPDDAAGQMAVLSRVYDLPPLGDEGAEDDEDFGDG